MADLVDCVDNHRSKWFHGEFGYVLNNEIALEEPIPCKGAFGLWTVPSHVARKINQQLER